MELELVFNELSCEEPAPNVDLARQRVERFVLTIAAAAQLGVKRRVRSTCDLQQLEIGPRYHVYDWQRDAHVDRDRRRYFMLIETKYPALSDEPALEKELLACDFFHNGKKAAGFGIAYRLDGLAISLLSSDVWNAATVSIQIREFIDQDIEERSDEVRHASHPQHVRERHPDWIRQRLTSIVNDGHELWMRSHELFPNLRFCECVASHMADLPKNALPSIMRGLFKLNQYASQWESGGFDAEQVGCIVSPDSAPTMQKYSSERTFHRPNGGSLPFSWHAKLGSLRIYFDPDVGLRQILIGYVGRHLRVVSSR